MSQTFFGRETEMAFLEEEFVQSLNDARVVVVEGPGGAGKTALIREFAKQLKSSEVLYLPAESIERRSLYSLMSCLGMTVSVGVEPTSRQRDPLAGAGA
jgi:Cdc6-like AAA superfamily ATPase